jgi:hypothetical protein
MGRIALIPEQHSPMDIPNTYEQGSQPHGPLT